MRRRLAFSLVCAAAIAACGSEEEDSGLAPGGPPAEPIAAPICSEVTYGGPGRPRLLIALSGGFQGIYKGHGVQTAQAIKMVLAERDWKAGEYTVGLQACEETDAATDQPSPKKCARNAHAFARNPGVIGVLGPLTSNCAVHMLATLNTARDGPLAVISGSNTYVGLTRSGPGTAEGEPEGHFPTGRRSYARLAPTDDVQGAANALYAQRHGGARAFVVDDGSSYGHGLAASFRFAAEQLGLPIAGTAQWSAGARSYRPIAARVRAAGADTVFVAGDISADGPKVIADLSAALGPDVRLMAGDSFNLPAAIVEAAGAGAEGLTISIAVLPNRTLPPPGRRFVAEFEKRFGQRPCCFSVHDAQAAWMLLDAIAASDGSRARVAENVMKSRVDGGLIGDFAIDGNGDTTLNTMGVYTIRRGKLKFDAAITPAPELLGRE
jgi:ABC-type branched-subunit amino acid transport system substrate-binding protein